LPTIAQCHSELDDQAETGAAFIVGHSYGGLIALEVARNNKAFSKTAVYEPSVPLMGRCQRRGCLGMRRTRRERNVDALVEFTLADAPPRTRKRLDG
jgi:pimeloyl-ACP methyl ester carboxylesterase